MYSITDVSAAEMKHRGGKNMRTVNYEDVKAEIHSKGADCKACSGLYAHISCNIKEEV